MNRLQLARTVMKSLAQGARKAQYADKKRILTEIKNDVETLWHLLADMREREVLTPELYQKYILYFSKIRSAVAEKEVQFS